MHRREFLKLVGLAIACPKLPAPKNANQIMNMALEKVNPILIRDLCRCGVMHIKPQTSLWKRWERSLAERSIVPSATFIAHWPRDAGILVNCT